jgi:Enterobacterial TraT complement resistance protein
MFIIKIAPKLLFFGVIFSLLYGCSAMQTSIAKRDLDVQTKTSSAIFVDAVQREQRTVYVDIRSSVMEFDRRAFKASVLAQFAQHNNGYRAIDDPDAATYHLNVFVLSLEKSSLTAAQAQLRQGYVGGGAILAGAVVGSLLSPGHHNGRGALGGALIAGVGRSIANALVKDVTFMLVADVQIKEKTQHGVVVNKNIDIHNPQGDSGNSIQHVAETSQRKEYRTRIVTTANKANLTLEEAQALMFKKTAYAMSGFF